MDCLQDGRPPRSELSWDLIYFLSTISLQITKNPEPDYPITFHLATVSNGYSIGFDLHKPYFFYRWSRRMARINPMMIALSKLSSTNSNCFFKEVYHYVVGHWSLNVLVNRMKCDFWCVFPQCEQFELLSPLSGAVRMSFCFLIYWHHNVFQPHSFSAWVYHVSLDFKFGAP